MTSPRPPRPEKRDREGLTKAERQARAAEGREKRERQVQRAAGLPPFVLDLSDRMSEWRPWQRYAAIGLAVTTVVAIPAGVVFALKPASLPQGFAFVQQPALWRALPAHEVTGAGGGMDLAVRACGLPVDTAPDPVLVLTPLRGDGSPLTARTLRVPMTGRYETSKGLKCHSAGFITPGQSGEMAPSDVPGRLQVLARIRKTLGAGGSGRTVRWEVRSTVGGKGEPDRLGERPVAGGELKMGGSLPLKKVPPTIRTRSGQISLQDSIILDGYWTIQAAADVTYEDAQGGVDTAFVPLDPKYKAAIFELSPDTRSIVAAAPNPCAQTQGALVVYANTHVKTLSVLVNIPPVRPGRPVAVRPSQPVVPIRGLHAVPWANDRANVRPADWLGTGRPRPGGRVAARSGLSHRGADGAGHGARAGGPAAHELPHRRRSPRAEPARCRPERTAECECPRPTASGLLNLRPRPERVR